MATNRADFMPDYYLQKRKQLIEHMDNNNTDSVLEWYNREAKNYHENVLRVYKPYVTDIANIFTEVTPDKDATILDVGGGSGFIAIEIKKYGYSHIDIIDGSREMLNLAEQAGVYSNMLCTVIGNDKIAEIDDGSYDGAVCGAMISRGHLSYKALPTLIRTLKEGAHLVFSVTTCNFGFKNFTRECLNAVFRQLEEDNMAKFLFEKQSFHVRKEPAVIFVLQRTSGFKNGLVCG